MRELRAAASRRVGERRETTATRALVLHRKALRAAPAPRRTPGAARLESLAMALTAHDPRRMLERGYAMVDDASGRRSSRRAAQAREARDVRVTFADGSVDATIQDEET